MNAAPREHAGLLASAVATVAGLGVGLAAMAVVVLPWPSSVAAVAGLGAAAFFGWASARHGWPVVGVASAGVWAGAMAGHEIVPSGADETVSIFDDATVFAVTGVTLLVLPAMVLAGAWLRHAIRGAPGASAS